MSDQPPEKIKRRPAILSALLVIGLTGGLGLTAREFIASTSSDRLPAALGSIPNWITGGGIMGILGLLVYWQLANRKIGVDADATGNVDRADIRDHYAKEVSRLGQRLDEQAARHAKERTEDAAVHRKDLLDIEQKYKQLLAVAENHFRRAISDAEERHDACVKDRDGLRDEVNELKDEVRGLRDQIRSQATDRVIALGDPGARPPSSDVMGAAQRMRDRLDEPGADKPEKR